MTTGWRGCRIDAGQGASVWRVPRILLVNGPNLDQLGRREPEVYGSTTLADIEAAFAATATELGAEAECTQHAGEGDLVTAIHRGGAEFDGIVINPGAYGHYGYALRDAIAACDVPVIEVHISNVHARESFRHELVLTPVVDGLVSGCGVVGYELALRACLARVASR